MNDKAHRILKQYAGTDSKDTAAGEPITPPPQTITIQIRDNERELRPAHYGASRPIELSGTTY